ncbi:MAG TPA: xanthine dehydrogenase family protein subunit M [Candidatus Limnocylindrales bacterium]|nr:xanthine dehydrogenase family protein subunit M [Candidatus Limnocylindrales bacterium]
MIPPAFDYVRPADIGEALRILREREGEAKILSGGYSLLPLLKLRLAQPALLVDIQAIGGLDGISRTDDDIRIGGRATHRRILEDDGLAAVLPIFRDTAAGIGDPQIRNWGTIGGSVAHADPSADWPAVLQALHASIVLRSADGERVVPARGFFVDTFQTGIEPAEILTEVRVPLPPARSGSAYQKLERRAGDFSTVGAAAAMSLGADGRIAAIGIGLTAVADAPFAATHAEDALRGATPGDALFREAAAAASRQSRPADDAHGPAEYKRAMVTEMTFRALRAALGRALA